MPSYDKRSLTNTKLGTWMNSGAGLGTTTFPLSIQYLVLAGGGAGGAGGAFGMGGGGGGGGYRSSVSGESTGRGGNLESP